MPVPWKTDFDDGHSVPFSLLGVSPTRIRDASDRAMSLRQLRHLRDYVKRLCKANIIRRRPAAAAHGGGGGRNIERDDRIFWFSINQYDINELILKRIIPQKKSCSWVELVADRGSPGQPPETYLSHACLGREFSRFYAVHRTPRS